MRKILILTVLMAFVALPAQAAQTRTDDAQTVSCDKCGCKAKAEGDKPCGCEGECKGDCKAKAEGDKPCGCEGECKCKKDGDKAEGDKPCGCEGECKCKKDGDKAEGDTLPCGCKTGECKCEKK